MVSQGKVLSAIDEIEAFADSNDEKILLNLSAERLADSPESIAAALRESLPNVESILIQDRRADKFHLAGPGYLTYTVAGAQLPRGPSFVFSGQSFLIEPLVEAVIGNSRGRLALDLFAGVGLFTVALDEAFRARDRRGIESGRRQGPRDQFEGERRRIALFTQHHGTEGFLSRWHETPDLVVVDPPRAGVETEALAHLKKLAPARIHYVSCDPATLARDLAQLVGTKNSAGPYEIESINLFDIFPQTYHMEVLVRLRRRA